MRWAGVVVVLAGCNDVFGLQSTILVDADLKMNHTCEEKQVQDGDEDGDGERNGTDNCPTLYNLTNPDMDGDGVGDVCDPHPSIPGDAIVDATYFETSLGCWTPNDVSVWPVADGGVAPTVTGSSLLLTSLGPNITVDVGFKTTVPPVDESLVVRLDQVDAPLECVLGIQVPDYSYIRLGYATPLTNGPLGSSTHHLLMRRTPTETLCTLEQATSMDPRPEALSTGTPITAALRADTTHITLTSVVVYASP